MNSCSDVLIDLEYRAWLADPEGYEAEQAAIREWHEYDMHDDPAFWEDDPEQATEQEGEDMPEKTFQPGEQIAYVPNHADGDVTHPDVEFGFVVRQTPSGDAYFCRYWRKGSPGDMRTLANSESTPAHALVRHDSVPQATVAHWWRRLDL